MAPYFTEKMRKYFFGCRCFVLLTQKSPFTYSHWERSNAHPKSQKIFYPFTYLELRSRNAPCFYKNFEKYFFRLRALILLAQKVPSLIPTGKRQIPALFQKIFCCLQNPFTYLELKYQNTTCFSEKIEKFFEKTVYLKNFPSLVPTGKGLLGIVIPKKGKKICPPVLADICMFIENNDSACLL